MTSELTPTNPVTNAQKLLTERVGYEIKEDGDQPGLWVWLAPTDNCESSYSTDKEALAAAWSDVVEQTLAITGLTREIWADMSVQEQETAILRALTEEGDVVQDVVDHVVEMCQKYEFQPDQDMVAGAVSESAGLLDISLSEEQIAHACERVISWRDGGPLAALSAQSTVLYEVKWDGYPGNPKPEKHDISYFTDDIGFTKTNIEAIKCLGIGEEYVTAGPMDSVTITRTK